MQELSELLKHKTGQEQDAIQYKTLLLNYVMELNAVLCWPAHHRVGIWLPQIGRFGTVEGLYRCDRCCRGPSSEYILDVEGLKCEKNRKCREYQEQWKCKWCRVKLQKVQGRCQNMSYSSAILDSTWTVSKCSQGLHWTLDTGHWTVTHSRWQKKNLDNICTLVVESRSKFYAVQDSGTVQIVKLYLWAQCNIFFGTTAVQTLGTTLNFLWLLQHCYFWVQQCNL